MTNLRANANALGVSGTNVTPVSVFGTIVATPPNYLPISGLSTQAIGSVQRGKSFLASQVKTFQQCTSENSVLAIDPNSNGVSQFTLQFRELFATAFKRRNLATSGADPTALADQSNLSGFLAGTYNTETGFYNSAFPNFGGRGNLGLAGLSNSGTRLVARFANIPAGVLLFAQASVTSGSDIVRIVNTDVNGAGPYSPVAGNTFGIAPIQVSNGQGIRNRAIELKQLRCYRHSDLCCLHGQCGFQQSWS